MCLTRHSALSGYERLSWYERRIRTGRASSSVSMVQPLFAKGANYIPAPYFSRPARRPIASSSFDDVAGSHFNMLRVWGGGTYEEDAFYDEADARGILIWQDFMFACTAILG